LKRILGLGQKIYRLKVEMWLFLCARLIYQINQT